MANTSLSQISVFVKSNNSVFFFFVFFYFFFIDGFLMQKGISFFLKRKLTKQRSLARSSCLILITYKKTGAVLMATQSAGLNSGLAVVPVRLSQLLALFTFYDF